ncbi:GRB2-associated-binding protein 3 isoform X2 [Terrapene carolina triunguis]|uniref:GRB2-associated-binding protein 3 isoform X2 n=1 Tax=Terrapene triunguis TaxID=2587831 RepID=UPI000E778282|nr:GRB2-associated-binding protein 3 isoform X2 [Terrapene carolina triunguis]
MSSGDVVCTGWLIKSPPEKKLKRYAWRKRWFVLRRGRMSGNPDVLEYYRNNHSKKPIRIIDLNECEVLKHSGSNFIKKEFQNNFVFIVKTTYRSFYLVAKTEEEMQIWVHNISQICNFGHLEDGTDSVESLSHTTSSLQPSPAVSTHTSRITDPSSSVGSATTDASASEETRSESESVFLPDYLFLSNCETGKFNHISLPSRCDSWSNSDRSLEQTSSDDVFVDALQSQPSLHVQSSSNGIVHQDGGQPVNHGIIPRSIDVSGPFSDVSSSSPLLGPPLTPTFQIDKSQTALPYGVTELDILSNTPPPRPPKPTHFSDWSGEELSNGALQNGHGGICRTQIALVPRRISLSSLDNVRHWKANMEGSSLRSRDKRLSLNLPCRFTPLYSSASDNTEDSYVPMHPTTSPPIPGPDCSPDGYTPMSPSSATFTFPVVTNDKLSSPLPELPTDLEPPPVNRDLKPRRKSRPPPLDLRNLSTIREHATLTRMWTVPYNRTSFISPDRDGINSARIFANSVSGEEEESYIQMKPFLSEEQRVDYVQVDEQKTQALQNTKQEWTDVRQSKV